MAEAENGNVGDLGKQQNFSLDESACLISGITTDELTRLKAKIEEFNASGGVPKDIVNRFSLVTDAVNMQINGCEGQLDEVLKLLNIRS